MFKKIAVAATLAMLASTSFAAAPSFYAGADIGSTKFDDDTDRYTSVGGFIGYQFHESLALEAGFRRLADFDVNFGGTNVGVTADQAAISLIGTLPLSRGFNIFGRLGYNRLEAKGSVPGFSATESTSGALYGVGAGFVFSPTVSARIEAQKPASDTTNVSAAVIFHF